MPGAYRYISFTDEQKMEANSTDLADFLRSQGESLKRSGNEYQWVRHPGVTISKNRWYSHYDQQGGYPTQFLKKFFGLDYMEAMTELLNGGIPLAPIELEEQEKKQKQFCLPESTSSMRHVYAYLMKQRCIDREIITHFARAGTLYEDTRHNAVFVGLDPDGIACNAHKKGTIPEISYRVNVAGSDGRYGFCHKGTSESLYVFEAPIDLLSFLTLYSQDWKQHSYIALDGVAEHAMMEMLAQNPALHEIYLCLDHDAAGIEASGRLADLLHKQAYTVSQLLPQMKDWNETLKSENGMRAIPASEHPKIAAMRELCRSLADETPDTMHPHRKLLNLTQQFLSSHNPALLYPTSKSSMFCAMDQFDKLGTPVTAQRAAAFLFRSYRPYKDRGGQQSRDEHLRVLLRGLEQAISPNGVYTKEQRKTLAASFLEISSQCLQNELYIKQQQPSEKIREAVSLSL